MTDLKVNGRVMHHDALYAALGLNPKQHLPWDGVPPTNINGVQVYVLAVDDTRRKRVIRGDGRVLVYGKRTFAICPHCSAHVEAGHLGQHQRGRRCTEARGETWQHPGFNSRGKMRRYSN